MWKFNDQFMKSKKWFRNPMTNLSTSRDYFENPKIKLSKSKYCFKFLETKSSKSRNCFENLRFNLCKAMLLKMTRYTHFMFVVPFVSI